MNLNIISILLFICLPIKAREITIYNNSYKILDIVIIPKGIMNLDNKKRSLHLKGRFASIKPNESTKLNFNNYETIDVKSYLANSDYDHWYKYTNTSVANLAPLLASNSKNVKMTIYGSGDKYNIKIGKKHLIGTIPLYAKIGRL